MPQDFNRDRAGQGPSGADWDSSSSTGSAQSTISRAREEINRQGGAALDSLKEGARSLGEEARDRASGYVEGGKEAVTEGLEAFAQAIRRASDELSERDQTMAAQLIRHGASTLERVTRSIEGTNLEDMIHQVRRFARNNPTAFIGGAMLAGFAVARFARASSRSRTGEWDRSAETWSGEGSGYGRGEDWRGTGSGGYGGSRPGYAGSAYSGGQGSSFASNTGGAGEIPPGSQGYAGGGMGTDPIQSSGPSSETDESMTAGSSSLGGVRSGAISTGETS